MSLLLSNTSVGVLGLLCSSNFVTYLLRSNTIFPSLRTLSFDGISCGISISSEFEQTRLMPCVSFCLLTSYFLASCVVLCILDLSLLIAFDECFTFFSRIFPLIRISAIAAFCKVCTSFSRIFEKSKSI